MSTRLTTVFLVLSAVAPLTAQEPGFNLEIRPNPPLPVAIAAKPYSVTFSTVNGFSPFTWSVSSGQLPPGTTFNPQTAILSGTPTTPGSSTFTIKVIDSFSQTAERTYTLQVNRPLEITTTSPLPPGSPGAVYSVRFQAAGGVAPYVWSRASGTLPTGFALDSFTGLLTGNPASSGTYSFSIQVTDAEPQPVSVTKAFTLSISAPVTLQTSAGALTFTAPAGGDALSQILGVIAATQQAAKFSVSFDGGAPGSPAPAWLTASPGTGVTPAEIRVFADPGKLAAGTYNARVVFTPVDGGTAVPVAVSLTVQNQPQTLDYAPSYFRLESTLEPSAPLEASLAVRNAGGSGALTVRASVPSDTPWLNVTPAALTAQPNQSAAFVVSLNSQGLRPGAYAGSVRLESAAGNADIPVPFFLNSGQPQIELSTTGLRFDARPGQGSALTQSIDVVNTGPGAVNWTAELLSGAGTFTVAPARGQSTADTPASITVGVRAEALAAGAYYGLLRVADPAALHSPQYVVLVLNVAASVTSFPELSPQGLVFVAPPNTTPAPQIVRIFASSGTPVAWQAAANSSDGAAWLTATPSSGLTSSATPGQLSVAVNAAGLKAGVYSGTLSITFTSATVRAIPVTLVVPQVRTGMASGPGPSLAGCTPTRLVVTSTGLASNFTAPAAWPVPLSARLNDDCGDPVTGAGVTASFSNGDPALPMRLTNAATGGYSATWTPRSAAAVTITLRAAKGAFPVTTTVISGAASLNPDAPALAANGTVNNLNPVLGAPVANGTVVAIYGTSLATGIAAATAVPLPTVLGGTRVIIGGLEAPLFYASPGQINAQLPAELDPASPQSVLLTVNNAIAVPDTVNLTAARPGVAAFADGRVIAQHGDYSLVTADSPAKPGEAIILYLVGMGRTDPPVKSGEPAPGDPLAWVAVTPKVTIDGADAQVYFAGLTPGGVGLYQINCKVPDNARTGDLSLVITQEGAPANAVKLTVAAP